MMKEFTTGPYEGFQVNESGTIVISPSGHTLKIKIRAGKNKKYGDRMVVDCHNINGHKKTIQVSRLVALAFVPNPDNKQYVILKDTNFKNVYFKNLEWATRREMHMNNVCNQKYKIEQFKFRKHTHAPVIFTHPLRGTEISVFDYI